MDVNMLLYVLKSKYMKMTYYFELRGNLTFGRLEHTKNVEKLSTYHGEVNLCFHVCYGICSYACYFKDSNGNV